jgi:hypothetical protein
MLQNEAPPEGDKCMACKVRQCNWRCLECIGGAYECSGCFRDRHKSLPFHRVENWTGTHFKQAWLCQVGVEIHLGHRGFPCPGRSDANLGPGPGPGPKGRGADSGPGGAAGNGAGGNASEDEDDEDYVDVSGDEEEDLMEDVIGAQGLPRLTGEDVCVLVDKSGVHRLRVRPCICSTGATLDLQFIDMGFFPASLKKIRTAFTFGVLDDFRMDNLECKTAGSKYFNKLKRLTSNAFPHSVPVGPYLSI